MVDPEIVGSKCSLDCTLKWIDIRSLVTFFLPPYFREYIAAKPFCAETDPEP